MGRGKRNPGCDCCSGEAGPCKLFAKDFAGDDDSSPATLTDLTVTAGTWDILSGKLKPTAANSRIVYSGNNAHNSTLGRVNTVQGSLGAIIRFHVRWTDSTDNIYIQLEYKSDHGEVKVFRDAVQVGDTIEAYDIVPDTAHSFHWFAASSVLIDYRGNESLSSPHIAGEWYGWATTYPGTLSLGFNVSDTRVAFSRAPSYYYVRRDWANAPAGTLWAITAADETGVLISAIDVFRTDEQLTPPAISHNCAQPIHCEHANFGPEITDNITTADWVASSNGNGVTCADADSSYFYNHDVLGYPAIDFTIHFGVELGNRSDGIEVIFDYLDFQNYKFWRINRTGSTATAGTGVDVIGSQFGEVLAGVETATEAIGVGDIDPVSPLVQFSATYVPEQYGNAPFDTAEIGGKLIGFKTLSTNVGSVTVTHFTVNHGLRSDPADPATYCILTGGSSVFDEGRHPRRWRVIVTGGDIPGTYDFELNQPSISGNRQWWLSGSDPFKHPNNATNLIVGSRVGGFGSGTHIPVPLGPSFERNRVRATFDNSGVAYIEWDFAIDTDGLAVSAVAHDAIDGMGSGASATLTALT